MARSIARPLAAVAARYNRILDYFMPPVRPDDTVNARNQARMFLISHTLGPFIGNSVPLALFIFDPTPGYPVAILAAAITSFWLFCFALKAGWKYDRLVFGSVIVLYFAIFWSCYHYGGISSPTLPWVLIIPILSLFYVGGERRLQSRLLMVCTVAFSTFLIIHMVWPMPPHDVPSVALSSLGVVSTIAALCYVGTMAVYYSKIFDAGIALQDQVYRRMVATDQMRQAVVEADGASRMKAEFLARMSHELRTPLNAVIGYGELLKEEFEMEDDVDSLQDVQHIDEAARYLLRLIDTILDLSKIEAGHLALHPEAQPISNLFDKLEAQCRAEVERSGNRLHFHRDPDLDIAEYDLVRMGDVCQSLIENATQSTTDGIVTVSARPARDPKNEAKGSAAGRGGLEIAVSDTGAGMEPARLTAMLYDLGDDEEVSAGRYGGTGVALMITKAFVVAMGGTLSASSNRGMGTTFTITLPPIVKASGSGDQNEQSPPEAVSKEGNKRTEDKGAQIAA